jgi:hypothetical protein
VSRERHRWRVKRHAPFGLLVEGVDLPDVPAVVDLVFMPEDVRGHGPEDFPPIGSIVEAAVLGRSPSGQLRLSMLREDPQQDV